ncbi:MAG: hypothetical protein KAH32_03670 [Chlamydiia bacterium]|nr:hypothetical protein [Chlamydiia bacterium]
MRLVNPIKKILTPFVNMMTPAYKFLIQALQEAVSSLFNGALLNMLENIRSEHAEKKKSKQEDYKRYLHDLTHRAHINNTLDLDPSFKYSEEDIQSRRKFCNLARDSLKES